MVILGLPHDAGRQVEGFRAGAADFIPSPVHLEELRARVRNQLALARARAHMNSAILVCQADRNRLASMVEGSIDALIATDLDGVITGWNQAATDLTGYTAKEGIGQSVAMLVLSGESEVMVADRLRRALEGPLRSEEGVSERRDGSGYNYSLKLSCIRAPDGTPTGFLGAAEDITERRRQAAALAQSVREKEELIKETHHRVKNNLAMIVSLMRIGASRATETETKAVLKEMQTRVQSVVLQ